MKMASKSLSVWLEPAVANPTLQIPAQEAGIFIFTGRDESKKRNVWAQKPLEHLYFLLFTLLDLRIHMLFLLDII